MSVLEEIEKLTQPVFQLPDLEDEDFDGTASKAVHPQGADDEDVAPRLVRSVIELSVDDSSKYGGTKVSRGDIFDEFSELTGIGDHPERNDLDNHLAEDRSGDDKEECSSEDNDADDDDESCDIRENIDEDGGDNATDDESISDDSGHVEDGDTSGSGSDGSESGERENQRDGSKSSKSMTMNDLLKTVDQDKHHKKAESVAAQTQTWEQLLYVKIKLQAALRAFNQLPRGQLAKDLLKDVDEEAVANLKLAHSNAVKLISSLLEAERLLLSASNFMASLVGKGGTADSDDEEIESSDDEVEEDGSEDDILEDDDDEAKERPQPPSTSVKSLSKRLCESEERFAKFRDCTLKKWDGRTRLIASRRPKNATTDFSAFEKENVVSQIEKMCSDKARLVKRCRVKKTDIERIGGNPEAEEDEEIYDDDDFYQVLLKELIDRKSSLTQDPVAMTRHYIEMQKLKSKRAKKRDIDHRASKDRKIKYIPIPKLVSFHPATPEMVEWNHETRNELFKSLFS